MFSFVWNITPEGVTYWYDIHIKYQKYIKNIIK